MTIFFGLEKGFRPEETHLAQLRHDYKFLQFGDHGDFVPGGTAQGKAPTS